MVTVTVPLIKSICYQPCFVFLQVESTDKQKCVVVSISPQSRASLAVKYNLTVEDAAKKLTGFFKGLGWYTLTLFKLVP